MPTLDTIQKVKKNGQITIPAQIRSKYQIKDGDYITTEVSREGIIIKVVNLSMQTRELN